MSEIEKVRQAIAALESQRAIVGDAVVDTAIATLREKLAALEGTAEGVQHAVPLPPFPSPQPETSEQRKQVTVLFADVAGFTAMAEKMDPEDVRDVMNSYFARLTDVAVQYEGTVQQFIGDAVLAVFGVPTAREDDPENGIQAALAMQQALGNLNEELEQERGIRLAMRIAVHSGPVLVGSLGEGDGAEVTVVGDTVNLASRLQQAAPIGSVLISHDTYRHVRGVFDVQALEPVSVKGRTEPVQVYLVRGVKPRAFRPATRGVEGIETRMIGREAELRHLQEVLDEVIEENEPRVVTVVGEAGVGKSRLLYEFNNWVELLPEKVWFFRARAGQRTSYLPYLLVRDLFSYRFEIQDSDPPALAREKLERGILEWMGPDGLEKAHFIGHLIGFDFSNSPYLRGILGDARQVRDRAFHYATQFFAAGAGRGAVVLFLEDIHWADEGSLDLVEHLAGHCGRIPLLVVGLTRPSLYECRPAWGQVLANHTRLDLRPLSRRDSRRLVTEILRKVEEVPADLGELIVIRAEGNPYYIEELIKVLVDDGVIVKGERRWQVRKEQLADLRVPATLRGVLQARLDGLSRAELGTMQRASVVGRIFWDGAVAQLGAVGRDKVQEVLSELRGKELVFDRKRAAFYGEHEWIFKHALLHEVTYESVLKRQRRVYHAQVARWLAEHSGERVGTYAGLIGEHFERAGETAQAAEWYERAGRQALDADAPVAASRHYQKALAFTPADPAHAARRAALCEGLAEALMSQARYEEAAQSYQAMQEAAEAAGDMETLARAWNGLSVVRDRQGKHRVALENVERAEEIARAAGAQVELARALCRKGQAYFRLGNGEKALAVAEQALQLSTALDARNEMARSLGLLGSIHNQLGHMQQAAEYSKRALVLYRELGNRSRVATALNNMGEAARSCGDYRTAIAYYLEARAIDREIGDRDGELYVLSNLGGARVGLGDYRTAEADLRQFLATAESSGWVGLAETYSFLAEACLGQGNVAEALAAAQRALAVMEGREEPALAGPAWRVMGMVARRLPERVRVGEKACDAATCFAESLRVLAEAQMESERARTLREWAGHELEQGDREQGERMWREAREVFARLGMEKEIERMGP